MIHYTDSTSGVTANQLRGFFVGWPNPPSEETHLRVLQGSYRIWLAIDGDTNNVVGFVNAISDGVLSAFIPLLEVLPAYQGQGIGTQLTRRILDSLSHLYSIDLICDSDLQSYYEQVGMQRGSGMLHRNYQHQSGS